MRYAFYTDELRDRCETIKYINVLGCSSLVAASQSLAAGGNLVEGTLSVLSAGVASPRRIQTSRVW